MYLVLALYALFASVFTISKWGLQVTEPFFFMGSRMVIAGALMLLFELWRDRKRCFLAFRHVGLLTGLGVLNIYLANAFEFWGLQHMTSFKTCFLYSISPFASALFSYFCFKETLSWKKWVGLLIGMGGLVPMLLTQTSQEELTGTLWIFSGAEIAVLAAAICSVWGWVMLRQAVTERELTPWLANGWSMTVGGTLALIHSSLVEAWQPIPVSDFGAFGLATVALIIVSNLCAYNLYGFLLKRFTATFLSFAGFTTPLFTALFGTFFLGEEVGYSFFFSMVILLSGLSLFYSEELKTELPVYS